MLAKLCFRFSSGFSVPFLTAAERQLLIQPDVIFSSEIKIIQNFTTTDYVTRQKITEINARVLVQCFVFDCHTNSFESLQFSGDRAIQRENFKSCRLKVPSPVVLSPT